MQYYIITVIYNQLISNCTVVQFEKAFLNKGSNSIIFVDNSTDDKILQENSFFCFQNSFTYIDMQGNQGLPKAYNKAISGIPKDMGTWIIICDQDTELTSDFLKYYEQVIKSNPEKRIFCPIVKDSVGIMSPSRIKGKKYIHSKNTDFNKHIENYSFINSCMCINSTIFDSVFYDENLFLDCVDHDFTKTVRKAFATELFYVMQDLVIYQNFSGVTKNSLKSDFIRFQIYANDLRYFVSKWYGSTIWSNKILFLRAIKLAIQHKKLSFIRLVTSRLK